MSSPLRSLLAEFTIKVDNSPLTRANRDIDRTRDNYKKLIAQMERSEAGASFGLGARGGVLGGLKTPKAPELSAFQGPATSTDISQGWAAWNAAAAAEKKAGDEAQRAGPKIRDLWSKMTDLQNIFGALAVFGGVRWLGGVIAGTINHADAVERQSRALGMSITEFQKWHAFAQVADVDMTALNTGFRTLSRQMVEAGQKADGDAGKAFEKLGVKFQNSDKKTRSLTDVLLEVGGALGQTENVAERTALATTLLGRSALQLIPAFSKGEDAIRSMMTQLERAGVVMDEDFIKEAAEAEDNLKIFELQMNRVKGQIVHLLIPAMQYFTSKVAPLVIKLGELTFNSANLKTALVVLSSVGLSAAISKVGTLAVSVGGLGAAFKATALFVWQWVLPILAIQDVISWLEGKDSVIGAILNQFAGAGAAKIGADAFKEAWTNIPDAFAIIWGRIIGTNTKEQATLEASFLRHTETLAGVLEGLALKEQEILNGLLDWAGGRIAAFADWIGQILYVPFQKIQELANWVTGEDTPTFAPSWPKFGETVPAPSVPGSETTRQGWSMVDERTITINVGSGVGGNSPVQVANAIDSKIGLTLERDRAATAAAFRGPGMSK